MSQSASLEASLDWLYRCNSARLALRAIAPGEWRILNPERHRQKTPLLGLRFTTREKLIQQTPRTRLQTRILEVR